MRFDFDPESSDTTSPYNARYVEIERANDTSWFVTNPNPTFDVILSTHSAGAPRDPLNPLSHKELASFESKAGRKLLGGNMHLSETIGPLELSFEERAADVERNIERICSDAGISPGNLVVLSARLEHHDTIPLSPINIDEFPRDNEHTPFIVPVRSDFIYTFNQNAVLSAKPADCPILLATAQTPSGSVSMLIHYPWRGVAYDYVTQTDRCFDALEIDRSTLQLYISPGAHAENFRYDREIDPRMEFPLAPDLFRNISHDINGWHFGIDTPWYVYNHLLQLPGIEPSMLYADTSDTGALRSGYSSHNRAFNIDPNNNTRDLLLMIRRPVRYNGV